MSDRDLRKELEELQNPDTIVDDILNLFRSWKCPRCGKEWIIHDCPDGIEGEEVTK